MKPLSPGEIRFHQKCDPPLKGGTYAVELKQTVTELKDKEFKSDPFSFTVGGPRFALAPADIYCVYPPDGAAGDFANSLPHIVFTRRTLPWETSIGDAPEKPWMALLLLSVEDGEGGKIPRIVPRKVSQLVKPEEVNVTGPTIPGLQAYEEDDPCNTVDLDARTFRKIAPRAADLEYLAHVREVNTDHKETLSFLTDGWFSVVIGNRFPKRQDGDKGVENRAILISLEGVPLKRTEGFPAAGKSIRLAVLASWTFHCYQGIQFEASMEALGTQLQSLRLTLPKNPSGTPEAVRYVGAAFSQGYAPLNHTTRIGDTTVSWYRGPLTPIKDIARDKYEFAAVPDGLVRYDYKKGMMDLTYAAASQLGRLLGLQDLAFAQTLCAWRTRVQIQLKARLRKEQLQQLVNSGASSQGSDGEFLEKVLQDALKTDHGNPPENSGTFESLLEDAFPTQARMRRDDIDKDPLIPPLAVRNWLTRRVLLYGVPFPYLVPEQRELPDLVPRQRMLPANSMRFFRLDPEWIKCLLEGACSVGRSSNEEQLVDEMLRGAFFELVMDKCDGVRQRPPDEGATKTKEPSGVNWPLEGFLLRSPVVKGWQGLEMEASYWQGGVKKPATALRIDRLGPDILLCIFNGPLAEIEIRQPPEGMHFGAVFEGGEYRKTVLRSVKEDATPGKQIDLEKPNPVVIPRRKDGDTRVIAVKKLAGLLEEKLRDKERGIAKNQLFTSAVFAVQMTESPGRVVITVRAKP